MAWIQVDDLSGEVIPTDHGHRLVLQLDDDEVAAWDVRVREDLDQLLRDLGEHLTRWWRELAAAQDADAAALYGSTLDPAPDPRPGESPDSSGDDQHERTYHHGDGTITSPTAAAGDVDLVDDATRVGEAEHGRATDAQVRTWCADNGVHHSTHGKLNQAARDAYEAAHAPTPDPVAGERTGEESAPPPAPELVPERAAEAATDDGDADPVRLLEAGKTPREVAELCGMEVGEVRDLMTARKGRRR